MSGIKRRTLGDNDYGLRDRPNTRNDLKMMIAHVTSVGWAREILRQELINASYCPVFEEELSYFFALRPAYKVKGSYEKHSLLDYFPVVFMLDASLLPEPYHIYPFDTGGAYAGAFDDAASPYIFLEDYALKPSLAAARDHIFWAYETPKEYFDGELRSKIHEDTPNWDAHAQSFLAIARLATKGSNRPDLRASSIEIAYKIHVPLKNNLKFAVFPKQFLEDERGENVQVLQKIQQLGIDFEVYNWHPNSLPQDFHEEINSIVRSRLFETGE